MQFVGQLHRHEHLVEVAQQAAGQPWPNPILKLGREETAGTADVLWLKSRTAMTLVSHLATR